MNSNSSRMCKGGERSPIVPWIAEYVAALEPILVSTLAQYEINSPLRVAHFMAQIGHETGGLRALVENLNCSANRLREFWPNRFPDDATAQQYANQPEKLANFVLQKRSPSTERRISRAFRPKFD